MSSRQNNVIITLLYDDDSTRNYTFEGVAQADLPDVKDKIESINANANNEYADFYRIFVSNDGASVTSISSAKIVAIQEEVIYSG